METKKARHDLRWIFLREFTRQLIFNSISDEERNLMMEEEKRDKETYKPQIAQDAMEKSPRVMPSRRMQPVVQRPYPRVGPVEGYMNLGKLNLFLADPRVNQIDCYGPEKEILVKISNQTQKTKVNLTKQEIDEIIKSFSEKTRIPLIKGVFRAALGNMILTAVISDFVDTRFTIQKRTPFQK